MVEVEVANRSGAAVDEQAAVELVREVLAAEGIDEGEVGLVFVLPEEARELKREHLGVDEVPDLVVCPDVVRDHWREPLIHGTLHLVGYDHGDQMAAREDALRR